MTRASAAQAPPAAVPPIATLPYLVAFGVAVLLFVGATARLLGVARDEALAARGGFAIACPLVLAGALALGGARWCLIYAAAYRAYARDHRGSAATCPPSRWPKVSILVPAFNEAGTIEDALASLVALDYPDREVIVVDDGSEDDTLERARQFARTAAPDTPIRVLTKVNGGKASAHNLALRHAQGELVLCVDADSRLEPDALRHLVARLQAHDDAAAAAGQIRVRNRVNLLTRLQALEYVIANGSIRLAQGGSRAVLLVPGPIGLFRRTAIEQVAASEPPPCSTAHAGHIAGPFSADTFAEDFDLSLALLARGHRIVYEPRAVARTRAPDWPVALLTQRYRWTRGHYQVLRKHRESGRWRALPVPVRAWLCATYGMDLFVQPPLQLAGALSLLSYLALGGDVVALLGWYAGFLVLNANATAFMVAIHRDDLALVGVVPFTDLYQSVLLTSGWLFASLDEVLGRRMRW